jgi:UDP-N-acetylglucosamine/UDP-N-acetylgalactosamine diphosphorylase
MIQDVLRARLDQIGQTSVLRFWGELPPAGRDRLASQLSALDFTLIAELIRDYVKQKPHVALPTDIKPVNPFPRQADASRKDHYARAEARGIELLRQGKVGAFLVAGGQGTRLGYDGPKGEFPVSTVRNKPLFQCFAEQLLAWSKLSGKSIPWYIMTSDANDARTRGFFQRHAFFGYAPTDVFFFQQGMMPAFATDGTMLLGEKDSLALSPDGHGGSLRAIERSGALADMKKRGIEHLSYFQVDNPLVHTIDPLFIGLHDLADSEMSSKTIAKAGPLEKVGNFCVGDGVLQVIEYSDLPESLARQTNVDGSLVFDAGSIAIHALRVSFIERLNAGGQLRLPWHRAEKKVPFVDDSGELVKPSSNNAVKLEQFVFDAIPMARNSIVYTTDRSEEFSPVKNADGREGKLEADSPATCRRDQVRRFARWLEAAGVIVPRTPAGEPDCVIEISPLYAATQAQLVAKRPGVQIARGASVVIE